MKKGNVLLIDNAHSILYKKLEDVNLHCTYIPNLNKKQLLDIISNYSGLIIRSKFVLDKAILDKAVNLKFIGRIGSGMENIDVEYATKIGIKCLNSPEGNRDAVAEHAIGMLLALLNNITKANNEVKNGIWHRSENRGNELNNKTIGILGYGNTGSAFAQRLAGFNVRVLAYDKYKNNYSSSIVEECTMETIFAESDILSIHLPLTKETNKLVNSEFLSTFNKSIYIINTSRGQIVETKELAENLRIGRIKGAALDVLEYESTSFESIFKNNLPKEFQYLIESDNVILSPHIAGWTHESNINLSSILADKILIFINDNSQFFHEWNS